MARRKPICKGLHDGLRHVRQHQLGPLLHEAFGQSGEASRADLGPQQRILGHIHRPLLLRSLPRQMPRWAEATR